MKIEVRVAKSTQTAVPELNREEKTLYFLIIGNEDSVATLNVGLKTYESVSAMLRQELEKNKNEKNNNQNSSGNTPQQMDKDKKTSK